MDKYLKELQEATVGGRSICSGVIGDIDGKTYLIQTTDENYIFYEDMILIDNLDNLKKPGGISTVYKFGKWHKEMRKVKKLMRYITKIDEGQLRVPTNFFDEWISLGKSQMIDNLKGWKLFPNGSTFNVNFKFLPQAIKQIISPGAPVFVKFKGTMKRIK